MGRRVVLKDHLAKIEERSIDIETADGQVFTIPPPQLWPDAVDDAVGEVATAKVIMGAKQYAEFVKAGGNARVLGDIISGGWEATVPES